MKDVIITSWTVGQGLHPTQRHIPTLLRSGSRTTDNVVVRLFRFRGASFEKSVGTTEEKRNRGARKARAFFA